MVGNPQGTPVAIIASVQAILNPRSPRDREVAEWSAASDVGKHPQDYAPKKFLFADWELVRPWFDMPETALQAAARANPELFGRYRLAVLDYEGACAKQLEALAWSARTLYRMRDVPGANTDRIDAAMSPIATVLNDGWGVPDTFLRDSLKRDWAIRFVRRYDLLPRTWREV